MMFKRAAKRFVRFFKYIYSDDVGSYNPKAEKITVSSVLYWVIGLALCFMIPAALVYIQAGEFDWNVFRFIWGEEETAGLYANGLLRLGSYIFTLCGNGFLLIGGFITPYRINGHRERLEYKKITRCFPFLHIAGIALFIFAMIELYC